MVHRLFNFSRYRESGTGCLFDPRIPVTPLVSWATCTWTLATWRILCKAACLGLRWSQRITVICDTHGKFVCKLQHVKADGEIWWNDLFVCFSLFFTHIKADSSHWHALAYSIKLCNRWFLHHLKAHEQDSARQTKCICGFSWRSWRVVEMRRDFAADAFCSLIINSTCYDSYASQMQGPGTLAVLLTMSIHFRGFESAFCGHQRMFQASPGISWWTESEFVAQRIKQCPFFQHCVGPIRFMKMT